MDDSDTDLGKIIGSNSHVDYVFEVYSQRERDNPPDPTDYEFGQFVYIQKEIQGTNRAFVGTIYDTVLVDPDQGRTGPRLAQPEEQNIFQPTYVDEKRVLAGVALLGCATVDGGEVTDPDHSIPRWTLEVDDVVQKLPKGDMIRFHSIDDELRLEYYQRMIDVAGGFAEDILSQILDSCKEAEPDEAAALNVIQRNLEWQTKMEGI